VAGWTREREYGYTSFEASEDVDGTAAASAAEVAESVITITKCVLSALIKFYDKKATIFEQLLAA